MSPDLPDGGAIGLLVAFSFFWFIFAVGFYVLSAFFLMKVFDKAGVQGRWRAWVPVYNFMVFSKLGDLSPWLVLYCLGGGILLSWTGLGFIFSFLMLGITGMAALVRLHDSGTAALLGDFLTCLTEKGSSFDGYRSDAIKVCEARLRLRDQYT